MSLLGLPHFLDDVTAKPTVFRKHSSVANATGFVGQDLFFFVFRWKRTRSGLMKELDLRQTQGYGHAPGTTRPALAQNLGDDIIDTVGLDDGRR